MIKSNEYVNIPSSCIIKIEPPADENENHLIDGDSIEQVNVDSIKSTHLDAIVEDSNEENSDDLDETIQAVR